MAEVVKGDALYHDSVKEQWIDLNQIDTPRNLHCHGQVLDFIENVLRGDSNVLELGGGVGFDLESLLKRQLPFSYYLFSEISDGLLVRASQRVADQRVFYCAIDATCLPLRDSQFDVVYMIAALHHLPDLDKSLTEMCRVVRDGGNIIFGIEPNKRMIALLNTLKVWASRLLPKKAGHSPADEEAEGFSISDFRAIAKNYGLQIVRIEPVWFLCGFVHYGLEFLYLTLRLKRRLQLPGTLERAILLADDFLLRIPGLEWFCWHYTVAYQKLPR
ncbi:MAG: methyltransferase domain-containing protein [Aphanocapsa lilacina HA4352-LM1]|nr:methyltransferase domain-containing protein [Aphanocapsa lilacina HA4352-LM1]